MSEQPLHSGVSHLPSHSLPSSFTPTASIINPLLFFPTLVRHYSSHNPASLGVMGGKKVKEGVGEERRGKGGAGRGTWGRGEGGEVAGKDWHDNI